MSFKSIKTFTISTFELKSYQQSREKLVENFYIVILNSLGQIGFRDY